MLFWTRSLLCVGTIVALALGHSHADVNPLLPDSLRVTPSGDTVMRLCRAAPEECGVIAGQTLTHASGSLVTALLATRDAAPFPVPLPPPRR